MANTNYTDKQIQDAVDALNRGEALPDGSAFNPAAFARGEPILRKMTPEERRDAGLPPATAKADDADDKKGA